LNDMQTGFEVNLEGVRQRIDKAAARSGRDPDDIKLVAVSKTHSVNSIRQAISAGLSIFGENKVQEAETKIEGLGRDAAEWRLIGHLQSNKARKAVQLFDVIESLDSIDLAKRLERICIEDGRSELPVFIEVDLAGEETKSGILETELPELVRILAHCVCLRFDGLMVLPPFSEDPEASRPYFQKLRAIRDGLQKDGAFKYGDGELSMGMSHDFEIAIEEGATVVRIGTAIFGSRAA
jgi:PLP dependent protein